VTDGHHHVIFTIAGPPEGVEATDDGHVLVFERAKLKFAGIERCDDPLCELPDLDGDRPEGA